MMNEDDNDDDVDFVPTASIVEMVIRFTQSYNPVSHIDERIYEGLGAKG